jgi:hypothetical protein
MIGYVTLPTDISREEYISYCLKTYTVSIETISGGFYQRVPISSVNLNLIDFPHKPTEKGSQVVFQLEDNGSPIIYTVLERTNLLGDTLEGDMKHSRSSEEDGSYIETRGSLKNGSYTVLVVNESYPQLILKVLNSKKLQGRLLAEVDGDVELVAHKSILETAFEEIVSIVESSDENSDESSKISQIKDLIEITVKQFNLITETTNLKSSKTTTLESQNLDVKVDKDVTIKSKTFKTDSDQVSFSNVSSFKIGKGSQPMILGTELISLLTQLITLLTTTTVTTTSGAVPLNSAPSFGQLITKLSNLTSKVATLE